jgi:hypothetical protein
LDFDLKLRKAGNHWQLKRKQWLEKGRDKLAGESFLGDGEIAKTVVAG